METDWTIPFDSAELGIIPMFVWCRTIEDAKDFFGLYYDGTDKEEEFFIKCWSTYRENTIYAVPHNTKTCSWLYGPRDSFSIYWSRQGYVTRVYEKVGPFQAVDVEDLL